MLVPLLVRYDPAHGGRWTSLRGGGREWLWHRAGTGREYARAGGPFIDAGGLEECVPTVQGTPDHGDAWALPWRAVDDGTTTIVRPDYALTRTLTDRSGEVVADYWLRADPGYRFIWAAHALLYLTPDARLVAPDGVATRVDLDGAPAPGPYWHESSWPTAARLDRLGPDDGTATAAVLRDCPHAMVVDGLDRLSFHLDCAGQPRSTALWRNLRGWPAPDPYRSIGVEPMLGAVFNADRAGADDLAVVPASGKVTWRLTVAAHRLTGER
jgi:hypothetical protein